MSQFAIDREAGNVESVDASKCRFALGSFQFMQDVAKAAETPSLKHPIKMLARSDQPVYHWYWGQVVHDIAGIKFHKPSIVVDYCHNDQIVLGYLDKFSAVTGGLECEGALVRRPNSMADEVLTNAENGVPYEASIFWSPEDGMVIENVMQGASVMVNGFQFNGPGTVIRQCVLHAVSICPHGHDPDTSTQFNQSAKSVSLTYQGSTMPAETTPATDPNAPSVESLQKQIAELETKFAAKTTEFDASMATAQTNFAATLEDRLKQVEAKFAHQTSSSADSVSGDGNDEGETKQKSFVSMFKYSGQKKPA